MPKVFAVTDSAACIPRELTNGNPTEIVPAANIFVDGTTYIDDVTLSAAEAYQLIIKEDRGTLFVGFHHELNL